MNPDIELADMRLNGSHTITGLKFSPFTGNAIYSIDFHKDRRYPVTMLVVRVANSITERLGQLANCKLCPKLISQFKS